MICISFAPVYFEFSSSRGLRSTCQQHVKFKTHTQNLTPSMPARSPSQQCLFAALLSGCMDKLARCFPDDRQISSLVVIKPTW